MFNYIPEFFKAETADTEAEADGWYENKRDNRRTPDLLPRDEVARAINSEVKAGRGSPHGGVFLDIATRRSPDYIKRRLPSMYEQFMELADVDITKEPMEVGPTCHYIMGGVRVDPETAATTVLGLYAAGEVAAGLHGSNRLGGNSLSDLLVFGRRAGLAAAEYAKNYQGSLDVSDDQIDEVAKSMLGPFEGSSAENPFQIHYDLQDLMQDYVGIIRTESELIHAVEELGKLKARLEEVGVSGNRQYNPGWHMALSLRSMLTVSEACALSAIERKESRGGHTRDDYPTPDDRFGSINLVTRLRNGETSVTSEPLPQMPDELKKLFEEH
jgi:succinate dehydrogenase / fumarate reductase flavoprotein subunit